MVLGERLRRLEPVLDACGQAFCLLFGTFEDRIQRTWKELGQLSERAGIIPVGHLEAVWWWCEVAERAMAGDYRGSECRRLAAKRLGHQKCLCRGALTSSSPCRQLFQGVSSGACLEQVAFLVGRVKHVP